MSAEQFDALGREVESRALARAVRWHTGNRVVSTATGRQVGARCLLMAAPG